MGIAPYEMRGASTRQKAMDLASRQGAAAQAYKMVPSKFDGCYGGIAAEIGAKNMPPACFLNAPTGGENLRFLFSPSVSAYAEPPPSQREALNTVPQKPKIQAIRPFNIEKNFTRERKITG